MRLFIASGFSGEFLDSVINVRNAAEKRFGSAVKWVEPGNVHLTYAFLGDIAGSQADNAAHALTEAAAGFKKVEIRLGAIGAFPSPEKPRVIWLGFEKGADDLKVLSDKIYAELVKRGFMMENKFQAHITIGRVKGHLDSAALKDMSAMSPGGVSGLIGSVALMESVLSSAGPKYRVIASRELL